MADSPAKVHLNLDTVERERIEPYVFTIGEKSFSFTDPTLLDWQVVESLTTLDAMAEHCMSPEDRKAFYGTPLPSFKLGILFEDVQRHFKLGEFAPKRRG